MSVNSKVLDKIDIIDSTEVPQAKLADFFEIMFPDRADFLKKHWRWWYRIDHFPEVQPPLVALLDGRVIGHVAQIPIILKRGDRQQTAAWGVDGGVLLPYRKSGIGSKLMDLWIRQFPICLGFCTEALFRILLKQGWSPRRSTYALQLPFRPDRHPRFRNSSWMGPLRLGGYGWHFFTHLVAKARTAGYKKLRETPLDAHRLEHWPPLQHPGGFREPLSIPRTARFLKWRLLDNPFREQHRILEMKDADVAAIVRLFQDDGLRRAHILCLSGNVPDNGCLDRFFGSVVAWGLDQDLDLLKLVSSEPKVVQVAQRWFPVKGQLRFAFYCHDANGQEMLRGTDHIWELIDYDLDFIS
jgi:hypothetical protein